MVLSFIKKSKIQNYNLPTEVYGNYWITDDDNKNISINIEAVDGEWILKNANDTVLKLNQFYALNLTGEKEPLILYCASNYENTYKHYSVKGDCELTIGSGTDNNIVVKNEFVSKNHSKLIYKNRHWNIEDLNSQYGVYVNNKITARKELSPGDIVFVMGLKIVIISNFILINNPGETVSIDKNLLTFFVPKSLTVDEKDIIEEENEIKLYDEKSYFLKSPRLRLNVETKEVNIEPPPPKEKHKEASVAITIGPMLTMGVASVVTGVITAINLVNKEVDLKSAIPSLVISITMLASMVMWPILTKKYEKKRKKQKEKVRQEKYKIYLSSKKKEIEGILKEKKHGLLMNNKSLEECSKIILEQKDNLWDKEITSNDFLKVKVGTGIVEAGLEIKSPEEHFSIDEDNLRDELQAVVNISKEINDAPVCVSLTEKYVAAIVGDKTITNKFLDAMLIQIMATHSYEDLKIVCLTNKNNEHRWDFLKKLPHSWTNDKSFRFFASNINDMQQVSNYLEEEFNSRKYKNNTEEPEVNETDYKAYSTYYLIITDDLKMARTTKIFKDVADQKTNYGFSLLIMNDKMSELPNDCSMFLDINENQAGILESELTSKNQKAFQPDFNENINMMDCALKLANIPIEFQSNINVLPDVIGFLEMYNVGKLEQLNILERWKQNNPVVSLKAPVGVDEMGELFDLDLHEKFHGPHGLIAGMTGSGKSEFIITYILSLAVNYHPDEVAIVLIDYKGGGLTGSFENKDTKTRLPHLAGTITNLDKVEIKRSLSSIQSELKKRQRIFNEARELLNEGSIDIYKYQRLYRAGQVKIPVPHLFIISDEFAELKLQQPEFMEQLISTARIGRSLGVHLILATQKPSGVVDDQIWSNSKFRVCLKVQDKSDSMDMIKCSDAATLKKVGRFYLQVGYNEFFALGQSAWAGLKYVPVDRRKKKVDNSIEFIDNTGYVLKNIGTKKIDNSGNETGEELINIVNYLYDIGKKEKVMASQLWLDKIPEFIYVDELKKKYSYIKEPYVINPVIGEYDEPLNQKQCLLTFDLTNEGNTIVYGTVGSGEDLMLNSLIYSTVMDHSVDEINIYIMDFGSETLRNFKDAPQVGDVIFINDTEKINNLLKFLRKIIEERKKLFVEYNGDYKSYCKNSGKKLPMILVIINYYEAFEELYGDTHEDILSQLTREGTRYGVVFVVTVSNTGTIRYKLAQNFKRQLTLQLNNEDDYSIIFGNVNGVFPSKIKGRGLVKIDGIYEFQTAYPCEKNNTTNYLKEVSKKLKAVYQKNAPKIPILPDFVNEEYVSEYIKGLDNLPIGVEKRSLKVIPYNFISNYITLITSVDIINTNQFVMSLIKESSMISNAQIAVIDGEKKFNKEMFKNSAYYNNNFKKVLEGIDNILSNELKIYEDSNFNNDSLNNYKHFTCFLVGIGKILGSLSPEEQTKFSEMLSKGRDLKKFSFIIVDSITELKNYELEEWYKTFAGNNNGIWIGNGIADQFILNLSKMPKNLHAEIGNKFGYYIKNGMPFFMKVLDFDDLENEDILDLE